MNMKKSLVILALFLTLFSCGHVISQGVRDRVDKELIPEILFRNLVAYKGRIILIGGIIVSSKNTEEGTYVEVLQKPLDYRGRPEDVDISHGRFIVFHEGYLDTAIYSMGKEITVAGEVLGERILPLGEIQYTYPLIRSIELRLPEPRDGLPVRLSIGIFKAF